jgi:hypothetical protein
MSWQSAVRNSVPSKSAANELADAFRAPDVAALEQLTEAERDEQERARAKLFHHLDQMWDQVNPRNGGLGGQAAEVTAGMRDIRGQTVRRRHGRPAPDRGCRRLTGARSATLVVGSAFARVF